MRASFGWLFAFGLGALGCGEAGGAQGSSSAEATTAAASGAASSGPSASAAAAAKVPTTKLTQKQLKETHDVVDDIKNRDPWDKRKAAYIAALGQPAKTQGEVVTWYGLDDKKCVKLTAGPDASSWGPTDESLCYGGADAGGGSTGGGGTPAQPAPASGDAASAAAAASASSAPATAALDPWAGEYITEYGGCNLKVDGDKVKGLCPGRGTVLTCTLEAEALSCTWSDSSGSGRAKLKRDAATGRLNGTWGSGGSSGNGGSWTFTPKKK